MSLVAVLEWCREGEVDKGEWCSQEVDKGEMKWTRSRKEKEKKGCSKKNYFIF